MHPIESEAQLLIVDQDIAVVEPLRMCLSESGFVARAITRKSDASIAIGERPPLLVIVNLDL